MKTEAIIISYHHLRRNWWMKNSWNIGKKQLGKEITLDVFWAENRMLNVNICFYFTAVSLKYSEALYK